MSKRLKESYSVEERLKLFEGCTIGKDSHDEYDRGACVMEWVSYLNNEPWSDHPECVDPVVADFCIGLNDNMSNKRRQLLRRYVTQVVGTNAGEKVSKLRRQRAIDWLVRTALPLAIEHHGHLERAERLRSLPQYNDDVHEQVWRVLLELRNNNDDPAIDAAFHEAICTLDSKTSAVDIGFISSDRGLRRKLEDSAFGCLDSMLAIGRKKVRIPQVPEIALPEHVLEPPSGGAATTAVTCVVAARKSER